MPVVSQEVYDSVCKAYDNEIALLKEQLENKNKNTTKNELDYCIHCGCPKDVCCGQGKISLKWLEEYCADTRKKIWGHNSNFDYIEKESLLLTAKKQAGEKK